MTPEEKEKLNQYLQAISEILENNTPPENSELAVRQYVSNPVNPPANNPPIRGEKDGIAHDISTQDVCLEIVSLPQQDSRWYQGLSLQIDQEILNGKIAAYQIRWFNGTWSTWFVPGMNDLDHKYNPSNNTMRRMWSYFNDHEHKYIICRTAK